MTLDAITARNRANAEKSTGPRSANGKAAVSLNARRHGATSNPDAASVANWLQIILDAPDLAQDFLFENDDRMRSALALADAEVAVSIAEEAFRDLEHGNAKTNELTSELLDFADLIFGDLQARMTKNDLRDAMRTYRLLSRIVRDETETGGRQHRLLKRYLREARGRRRKAFQTWLSYLPPAEDNRDAA